MLLPPLPLLPLLLPVVLPLLPPTPIPLADELAWSPPASIARRRGT